MEQDSLGEPPIFIEITASLRWLPRLLRLRSGTFSPGRDSNDRKRRALIDGLLEVVDRLKPLHLSIVGGDPLVWYRELD